MECHVPYVDAVNVTTDYRGISVPSLFINFKIDKFDLFLKQKGFTDVRYHCYLYNCYKTAKLINQTKFSFPENSKSAEVQ